MTVAGQTATCIQKITTVAVLTVKSLSMRGSA
jgi:hypothetical protein